MASDYRELIVWQKAKDLAKAVYRLSSHMPEAERFGLTAQMRRCAVSVPSNIAEGNARESRGDYIRLLGIARGSLAELETQLIIAQELGLLKANAILQQQIPDVVRLLQALIRNLRKTIN